MARRVCAVREFYVVGQSVGAMTSELCPCTWVTVHRVDGSYKRLGLKVALRKIVMRFIGVERLSGCKGPCHFMLRGGEV